MARAVTGYLLILVSVLIWILVPFELANHISIGIVCSSLLLGGMDFGVRRARGLVLASACMLSAMLALVYFVRTKADAVALDFIENTRCRVSAENLLALDDGWSRDGAQVRKPVRVYGATRELRYQENGLFRYGFMNDKTRTVWIESCKDG